MQYYYNYTKMGDFLDLKTSSHHVLYKVKSSAMKFKLKAFPEGLHILFLSDTFEELYNMFIGPIIEIVHAHEHGLLCTRLNPMPINPHEYQDYWITWYNGQIRIGRVDHTELLAEVDIDGKHKIGYVRFPITEVPRHCDCIIEKSPINLKSPSKKIIEDGKLHWVRMYGDGVLPPDAMVGGFENELIYIARAHHNGSLCPGKFVPSKKAAYIPWGHREHEKKEFEILCGFNADWVSTRSDHIPENAFVAGNSEVRNGPLYIGRAMHDGYILVGKVHTLYKSCYLPYKGEEIEVGAYDILVMGGITPRGLFCNNNSPPVLNY